MNLRTVIILSLLVFMVVRASALEFSDDFNNRTNRISLGEPLGPGWAVSSTANNGGTWSVGAGPAAPGTAQPNISQTAAPAYAGAQYVASVADLSSTEGWKLSVDLKRIGQPVNTSGGQFRLLANWNGKEPLSDSVACTGLVFEVDVDQQVLKLYEKQGANVTTLRQSQQATATKQFAANTNYFGMGFWDSNFLTFTLKRRGNRVMIHTPHNENDVNSFNSGWLSTTLPNTGFVGVGYSYRNSGRDPMAFDNFNLTAVPESQWVAEENVAKVTDVKFAYFPYSNTIKTRVNMSALDERDKVREVKLSVRKVGQASRLSSSNASASDRQDARPTLLATTRIPRGQRYTVTTEWKIPPLKEGSYQFVVQVEGGNAKPIVTDFVRHVMAWEHNKLGKSDVIIEPFEPIRLEKVRSTAFRRNPNGAQSQLPPKAAKPQQGDTAFQPVRDETITGRMPVSPYGETVLHTVLRTHLLNNLGLWDQIESLDKPLLTAPMRLEVKIGGRTIVADANNLKFTQKKPTRVVTESRWNAGGVRGTTHSDWDYDGLMKWTLDIRPSKERVEAMTLVIPLDDKAMTLFHPCTHGLRGNYAGFTPAGQGRIWESRKTGVAFLPYVWLGAEERGLAVFGENDRGWVRDPKVSCQELMRHDDTLELRLNLIATPIGIEQPRRIVIGFQVTPTKPMPEGWRTWTMAGGGSTDVAVDFRFSGTCYSFGTIGPCYEIYPRKEDFSIYEKLAETRRTGKIDEAFIEKWLAGYPPADEASRQAWRGSVRWCFQAIASKPDGVRSRFLQYTNGRGVGFDTAEGRTFVDEWHRAAFPMRSGTVWYDLDPVESFRDYAMWYYKKMLDTFVDDIYWDDMFLQPNFDTVGTDAYELPDGTIQPSSGLWNLRELVRRTAVLNHERGKRGYNQPHMTNTEIVPILSFAGTQLSWEDRAGDADFQDRFSRDYIRTESIGRQSGNVPFLLTLVNGPDEKKNQWAKRTNAGVTLTHEIKPHTASYYSPDYWSNFLRLLEFGYGKPETHVWNYWDPNYPARIEGSETSSLIVSKPGRAMIVVCDYGNGGDLKLKLDPSLGLGEKVVAKDMESNQPVGVGADGVISFLLKKHDFKVVVVETVL